VTAGWRAGLFAGLVIIGVLIGVIGGFVQASRVIFTVPWGLLVLPWGTIVVLATVLLAVRGACWAAMSRWGGAMLFAGWLLSTVAMATESPSGDLAISAGGRQWAYVLVGVVIGAAAVTFPVLGGPRLRARHG
jgi:hypothetical protein